VSDYGPSASNVPNTIVPTPGLYRGAEKIGNQNLTDSLTFISSNVLDGDEYYIVLGANESISPQRLSYTYDPPYSYPYKNVGITLLGYNGEKIITLSSNGCMFTVSSGVTLILDENVTLIGWSTNNRPLVDVINGKLIMNDGAKISGNISNNNSGGGVCLQGGNFTMNGGEISGNTAAVGGGVYSKGVFIMNGGKIINNISTSSSYEGGGGVFGYQITINGGEINGNTADTGGGIYCSSLK